MAVLITTFSFASAVSDEVSKTTEQIEPKFTSCEYHCFYNIGPGVITGDYVNCRSGPGTNYYSKGQYMKGTIVSVKGGTTPYEGPDWSHVHGKYIGFVYNDYVTVTEPACVDVIEVS